MSDGLLALFIALVVGIGLFVLAVIWDGGERHKQRTQEPPYMVGCAFGGEWPTRWPEDEP